jgi:hypothetical protein
MVRDAAAWAMKQTLLDEAGFTEVFGRFARGDDLTRGKHLKALGIRADAVMTQPRFNKASLTQLLAKALNDDPHPGVRAWAAKAAWQWWVWNPPLRVPIQQAWARKLLSPEPTPWLRTASAIKAMPCSLPTDTRQTPVRSISILNSAFCSSRWNRD